MIGERFFVQKESGLIGSYRLVSVSRSDGLLFPFRFLFSSLIFFTWPMPYLPFETITIVDLLFITYHSIYTC
jgi:hypothetical protein